MVRRSVASLDGYGTLSSNSTLSHQGLDGQPKVNFISLPQQYEAVRRAACSSHESNHGAWGGQTLAKSCMGTATRCVSVVVALKPTFAPAQAQPV